MKKIFIFSIGFICCFGSDLGFCADDISKKVGTSTAQFLKMGATARVHGMGGAFVGQADDASAVILNPGGLGFIVNPEFQAMHALWLADTYYNYFGYVQPTVLGGFGLSVQHYGGPKITSIKNGVKGDKFDNRDLAVSLAYGKSFANIFSLGFNVKHISSKLAEKSANTLASDVGLLLKLPGDFCKFGVSGENIGGGRLKYDKVSDPIPYQIRTGFGFNIELPQHYSEINILTEAIMPSDNNLYYVIGIEHWGGDIFALRFGYKFLTVDTKLEPIYNWCGGLGLNIKGILIDYSYNPFGELGNVQRISLGYRFLDFVPHKREVETSMTVEPLVFSPNSDAVRDTIFFSPKISEIKSLKSWKLDIREQDSGSLIKSFTGEKDIPGVLVWDGKNEEKTIVPEGRYKYDFSVKGEAGKIGKHVGRDILIDLSPPKLDLVISSATFSPNGDNIEDVLNMGLRARDESNITRWTVAISNEKNKIVKVIKSTASLPMDIVWDGTDDYYSTVVPDGMYMLDFSAWDEAGNRGSSKIVPVELRIPPKLVSVKETDKGLIVNLSSKVLFSSGKAVLKEMAKASMDEVVKLLQAYPENKVLIEGHTDSIGSAKSNMRLSSKRAWEVYSYFVRNGINPNRLAPKGLGESNPIASNETSDGRSKNRRVEITILKKEMKDKVE
ncbi:MAG: PorV/PorQ family protein [bacterium]